MNEPQSIPLEDLLAPSKPCPFCGSTALELNAWEEYVVCKNCDASAPAMRWQFRAPMWNKVNDWLPAPGPVLIFEREIGIVTAAFTHKKFFHSGHEERPTHWHPMPPPPTE
jgi:RNA polymerase subunit RPABC4/transcription elongation factor Spt4